jgi:hypothetical protein
VKNNFVDYPTCIYLLISDNIYKEKRRNKMKKDKDICMSKDCFMPKEYGSLIIYNADYTVNDKTILLNFCLHCRIKKEKEEIK